MIDNNIMNSVKAYKALSVVANVEQGALTKRLIKENKFYQSRLDECKKHIEELQQRLEDADIWTCMGCDYWCNDCEWLGESEASNGSGWYCEQCAIDDD